MIAEIILKVAGFEKGEFTYHPRPSNAGLERCLRAMCYQAQNYRGRLLADRFFAVMDDSSWHEELTLDFLRKSSFQVHSEQMVVECGEVIHNGVPFMIRGKIDGLLTDLAGVDRLFEHKAINHFTFERYAQEQFPLDYLTQMAFYFVGLTKVQPDVKEGVLLIKNKNTSQYLEFLVDYDVASDVLRVLDVVKSDGIRRDGKEFTGLYGHAMERFAEVERHRSENTLPPRQYDTGDWHCSYCGFSQMCDSSYEEEFSSFTEGADLSEIEDTVKEYVRLSDFKKRTEKTLDEVKEEIKRAMKAKECKKAKSNGYLVSLSLQKRQGLDKSLIPPEILKDVQKETLVEVLNVKHEKLNKKFQKEDSNV
ncbi:MAG: hypothetical protein KG012_03775 [Deltaproteobacteria bacterium]|nr:hypothetical protein [Syntrophaceae bacterium]MBS3917989.1 hypothetical protein [Deltaproteobacteria bacterium]